MGTLGRQGTCARGPGASRRFRRHGAEVSDYVRAIINCTRIMSSRLDWLIPEAQPARDC
jgi:hypothetical protein